MERTRLPTYRSRAEQLGVQLALADKARQPFAAAVVAVQCAIASADAVCVAYLAKRAAENAHQAAAQLLESCPLGEAKAKADQFRRILELKYAAEYDDRELTKSEVEALVTRTRRFHLWAMQAVDKAPKG